MGADVLAMVIEVATVNDCQEIVSHYNAKGSQVFKCMLDATKAFDKVDFVKLFELLMRGDIPGVFLRLILDLYTRQRLKTAWDGTISLIFSVTNGVRQGGVLSPILFNVYFDELLQKLQDHDIVCHVGTKFVWALGYADDLTLLSPSLRDCKRLLIYVMILPKNTQWNLIRRRLNVCVLEKMVNSFKVISIWTEKSYNWLIVQGTRIIWSHGIWKMTMIFS